LQLTTLGLFWTGDWHGRRSWKRDMAYRACPQLYGHIW
jgi:hypothetical protein